MGGRRRFDRRYRTTGKKENKRKEDECRKPPLQSAPAWAASSRKSSPAHVLIRNGCKKKFSPSSYCFPGKRNSAICGGDNQYYVNRRFLSFARSLRFPWSFNLETAETSRCILPSSRVLFSFNPRWKVMLNEDAPRCNKTTWERVIRIKNHSAGDNTRVCTCCGQVYAHF